MALVLVAVAVRAALPLVARSVVEDQATALLAGRVTVGDVDLSLLRGEVALKDVTLRADDAGPDAIPLVAWRRLWVNVGWIALLRKTLELQDVGLAGLSVHVDRLANGDLVLPSLRPGTEPEAEAEPEAAPAEEPSKPWGVVIRHLTFVDGALQLDDHVADPPETRRLSLPALRVANLRLQPGADAGEGRGRLRIRFGDGSVQLRTRVRPVEGGFDVALRAEVHRLPIDDVHVHLPALGWSGSTGRLDAVVSAHVSPTMPLVARGRVALDDLGIEVPNEEGTALGWRHLGIEVERVDLAAHDARVGRIELDGGRVLVRPTAPVPLPVLPRGTAAKAEPTAAEPASSEDDAGASRDPPWTWSVGTVEVTDTHATVFLEPPPLDVDLRTLDVKDLASAPGSEASVHAEIGVADGTLELDGPVVLDPPGGSLEVRATDVDAGRLVAASGAAPLPVAARLDADLDVAAREDPLVVTGRLDLRDVEAKVDDGEQFLVAWKRLGIGIDRIAVPGLLPFGGGGTIGDVTATLASVELEQPRVVTTLAKGGLVLPAAAPAEAAESTEPAGASTTPPAGAAPPAPAEPPPPDAAARGAFSLAVAHLAIEDGDVRFTDETVTPAYRGRLADLDVDARGLRVPENRVQAVTLSTRVGGKAPIEVASTRRGDQVRVTGTIRDVPLAQFNPYATAYGYRVARGTLSVDSETTMRGAKLDSENRLNLDRLAVTGAEGEALFKKTFGVPLGVALALLRDVHGRISLGVPISGGEGGTSVDIGPIVREALTRAIVGALASPLKLLGAVRLGQGRIEAFEPAPIAFVPGTTELAEGGAPQAEQLGAALDQLPTLRVRITGRAGANDARALAERAVLADLEEESGFVGGVRNVLSGGTRAEVRDALRARARGEAGPLQGDAAEQLDEWVAEHPVDDARLRALAAERAAALERLLVEAGAKPEQIVRGEPEVRRTSGLAEVEVAVAEEQVDLEPAN